MAWRVALGVGSITSNPMSCPRWWPFTSPSSPDLPRHSCSKAAPTLRSNTASRARTFSITPAKVELLAVYYLKLRSVPDLLWRELSPTHAYPPVPAQKCHFMDGHYLVVLAAGLAMAGTAAAQDSFRSACLV